VTTIPIINVALAFIPVLVVLIVMFRWSLAIGDSFVALGRMLIQLIVIGYALTWIFLAVIWLCMTIFFMIRMKPKTES
jgi:putative ABC transport system permease protein